MCCETSARQAVTRADGQFRKVWGIPAPLLYGPGVVVLVAVLYALGGVVPLVALGWAALRVRRTYLPLCRDLEEISALMKTGTASMEQIRAVREPQSNDLMLWYTPEVVERAILKSALADLKRPSLLAALGVVFGTAGGPALPVPLLRFWPTVTLGSSHGG